MKILSLVIATTVLLTSTAFGQINETKIFPSDPTFLAAFGTSTALSGDYAIIGAPGFPDSSNNAAYIFKKNSINWNEEVKLTSSDATIHDGFGSKVAIFNDFAIVSSPGDDDNGRNSGSAYIFKRSGTNWIEEAKLTANDAQPNDFFGESVSISNNYAIVGASYSATNNGVYIYEKDGSNWNLKTKLTASGGFSENGFGFSVSLDGNTLVVGAPADGSLHEGAVYVFVNDGTNWNEEARIAGVDTSGTWFGNSADVSGDYFITATAGNEGYIYERSGTTWSLTSQLFHSSDIGFPMPAAIFGNHAIIGTIKDLGSVVLFANSGSNWILQDTLLGSDITEFTLFGWDVDISQNNVIVGAPIDIGNGLQSGSAYIYNGFEITGIEDQDHHISERFILGQNYPNPFNPSTIINYQLPINSEVQLVVYDLLGQEVATLVNGRQAAGSHAVTFSAKGLPSGVYLYRLSAGSFTETRKMLLVR